MKKLIAALLLTTAAMPTFAAVPESETTKAEGAASADAGAAKEMDAMMSIFGKLFDTSNLPEPEPARLKLATVTASKLLPDGAYAKIMDDMMKQMLTPLFNLMPGLSNSEISSTTGAPEDVVASLNDEQKAAVTQIIDPYHKQRGEQTMGVIMPLINEAMAIIEPAMRTGLSRAYARKFTAAELTAINGFFTTPTGNAFARESFALQADPEVLQATFKALPTIFTSMIGDKAKFEAKFAELPKKRTLADLSNAEMQELAKQLGVTVKSLEDHKLIATETDPYATEAGTEPWYSEEAWASGTRKEVKALQAKYDELSAESEAAATRSSEAYETYEKAWKAAVDAARKRMLAEGWTPPVENETEADADDAVEAVALR
jgi:hypothetical protein